MTPRILLKARPTPAQIADRLTSPMPEGLELYLDYRDLDGDGWLQRLLSLVEPARRRPDFTLIVEGPMRSLDGSYFDVTQDSPVNQVLLERLVAFAETIGAVAVNIHTIEPGFDPDLTLARSREAALARAIPPLQRFAQRCLDAGLLPLIENNPPVGRLRAETYSVTSIGVEADDLLHLSQAVSGLQVTCDLSHAQLYLNCLSQPLDELPENIRPAVERYRERANVNSLAGYIDALGGLVYSLHISNASGVLGEGLPYAEGDLDLDHEIERWLDRVACLVTETIEENHDRAIRMREAQSRLQSLRGRYHAGHLHPVRGSR